MNTLICLAIVVYSLVKTNGTFVYLLDDTYIHMAMAKSFSTFGTWGVNRYQFGSASSSPLYTGILSLMQTIVGDHSWWPLSINILFSVMLLHRTAAYLQKKNLQNYQITAVLTVLVIFTPLPLMTLIGMEHVLHIYFCVILLFEGTDLLSNPTFSSKKYLLLCIIGALAMVTRYESIFLVAFLTCNFFFCKRALSGIGFLLSSISLASIFGLISIHEGSYFFPNSVLLKGTVMDSTFTHLIKNIFVDKFLKPTAIFSYPAVILSGLLCPLLALGLNNKKVGNNQVIAFFIILSFALFSHVAFASLGWFVRYEAYLIYLSLFISSIAIFRFINSQRMPPPHQRSSPRLAIVILPAALYAFALAIRIAGPYWTAANSIKNIYEQQYQMGQFINKYYTHQAVATNDIGAVNYLSDIHSVDLFGLGSIEVAKSKRNKTFTSAFLTNLLIQKKVRAVIIYNYLFADSFLNNLKKVAYWKIPHNTICGSDTVYFYTLNKTDADTLSERVKMFSLRQLPKDVTTHFY